MFGSTVWPSIGTVITTVLPPVLAHCEPGAFPFWGICTIYSCRNNRKGLRANVSNTAKVLQDFGWVLKLKKLTLELSYQLEYLGPGHDPGTSFPSQEMLQTVQSKVWELSSLECPFITSA